MAVTTARRATAARALWAAFRGAGAYGVGDRFRALPRLAAATMSGRYRGMSRGRLGLLLAGAVYVVSPIDAMPELLLTVFGLGDDALVIAWLAGTVLSETEAFLGWESGRRQGPTLQGEVVDDERR